MLQFEVLCLSLTMYILHGAKQPFMRTHMLMRMPPTEWYAKIAIFDR